MTNREWIRRKILEDDITIKELYCDERINRDHICSKQRRKCAEFPNCDGCIEDWLNQEKEYLIYSCPFCNFTETRVVKDPYTDKFCVSCVYCGAQSGQHETEESAVESWNSIRRKKDND